MPCAPHASIPVPRVSTVLTGGVPSNGPATYLGDTLVADPMDRVRRLRHQSGAKFCHFGAEHWISSTASRGSRDTGHTSRVTSTTNFKQLSPNTMHYCIALLPTSVGVVVPVVHGTGG